MKELEKRFKRGMRKVIKANDEGLEELGKKWRNAVEKEENGKKIYFSIKEITHITRKLFQIPTHMKIKEEIKIACAIIEKLWKSEIIGDPENIFKEDHDD